MATPNPSKAAAVATPPVSTPFSNYAQHLGFSPHGPRSVVPSPQQVKKSPANSNTLYGYPSGGAGGYDRVGGYDSPSAAMALGGLGEVMDLGMDGLGVLGGSQGLGLGGHGTGVRGDEDERKRKMAMVVDILKTHTGRLSEKGLQRLAESMGLDCMWLDDSGNIRTFVVAGKALSLDSNFLNNRVQNVALSFPDAPEIVTRHEKLAGEILKRDLELGPNESPITKKLDRFAANLERLTMLDKLTVPGLNCHEAVAGIYQSLEKLYKWEIERLKEQDDMRGRDGATISRTVMCLKSGKPLMHSRNRLGFSIDYWQEKRLLSKKSTKNEDEDDKKWSLLVEVAPLPELTYRPIRVSEKWISDAIKKPNPPVEDLELLFSSEDALDWLEPENTLLSSTKPVEGDAMEGIDAESKYPAVMFVAKFDPPLIVPYGIAIQIYASCGVPLEFQTTTFDGILFPHRPEDKHEAGEARTIMQETAVPVFSKGGKASTKIHKNTLFIEKIDYGRILSELPFSHPRQLVEMLPTLRQYAFLSTLLLKTFGPNTLPESTSEAPSLSLSKKDEFLAFMSEDPPFLRNKNLKIDVSFSISPSPRLQVVFPFMRQTANVTFDIRLNGVVEVASENIIQRTDGKQKGRMLSSADLGKMLEITEDLGIWVEFVRRRLGGAQE